MHLARGAVQFDQLFDRGRYSCCPAIVSSDDIINLKFLDCVLKVPEARNAFQVHYKWPGTKCRIDDMATPDVYRLIMQELRFKALHMLPRRQITCRWTLLSQAQCKVP